MKLQYFSCFSVKMMHFCEKRADPVLCAEAEYAIVKSIKNEQTG